MDILRRLNFGAGAWNLWRAEQPGAAIVLDGARLDGMILTGVDLHEADLLGADGTGAVYSEQDLRGALHAPPRTA